MIAEVAAKRYLTRNVFVTLINHPLAEISLIVQRLRGDRRLLKLVKETEVFDEKVYLLIKNVFSRRLATFC